VSSSLLISRNVEGVGLSWNESQSETSTVLLAMLQPTIFAALLAQR
jgi:hypothetical protein